MKLWLSAVQALWVLVAVAGFSAMAPFSPPTSSTPTLGPRKVSFDISSLVFLDRLPGHHKYYHSEVSNILDRLEAVRKEEHQVLGQSAISRFPSTQPPP